MLMTPEPSISILHKLTQCLSCVAAYISLAANAATKPARATQRQQQDKHSKLHTDNQEVLTSLHNG